VVLDGEAMIARAKAGVVAHPSNASRTPVTLLRDRFITEAVGPLDEAREFHLTPFSCQEGGRWKSGWVAAVPRQGFGGQELCWNN
jgi:hypothetical protein